MAKGVKKIKWIGNSGALGNFSKKNEILCIEPNQVAPFVVGEWYDDTTEEEKKRNITWLWMDQKKNTTFNKTIKPAGVAFGVNLPKKLCGSYAFYLEASLYGAHDHRNTGLHVYGRCEEKITASSWSKIKGTADTSEINYGHDLFITLEAEGVNGDNLTLELYSAKKPTPSIQTVKAKCINGKIQDAKFTTMPCFTAIPGLPDDLEDFYIKVLDITGKHITNASGNDKVLSFTIKNKRVIPVFETPTNNTPMRIGTTDADPKEEEKKAENTVCSCKDYDLIWGNKVGCEFRKKVVEISKDLWPDKYKTMANGLMAVMKVETSETFSPSKIELVSYIDDKGKKRKKYQGLSKEAINKLDENFSGAVGLIQFTKDAIDALNKENSLSLNKKKLALMTDVEQLEYVKKYFMLYNWHKKLLSPEDIYLQVFAPIGIAKNDNYVLYQKYENPETEKEKTSTKNYNANKSVDQENNNDNKIQRVEILGRYRTSFAEGLSKKEKEFSCGVVKDKEESNDIGILDEMKALVDKHIPYSQLGVRNSLSEKGLKGLDCSETVSIYLTKLGITTSVKEINTGVMTTQKDFRKAIDSENIDFVSGSASKDFKPKRGDIFVWRRSDGVGHTGIVYDIDEKTDLVTILEAIGNVGSADETTNNNNGGYSGKGSSRTAVYKRTGKALSSHAGWKGYFRPKNYTKKL